MLKALLIPSYEPDYKTVEFLQTFKGEEFDFFLVVNDGSDSNTYQKIFEEISTKTPFKVVGYEVNHGKGYALKYGIKYLVDNYDVDYIITADSDGQHTYKDILNIRDNIDTYPNTLLLGSRNITKENAPKSSSFGNAFSSKYFKIATGKKLKDTQTGLRAIPKDLFHLALTTNGRRYEYEMNFLTDAVRNYPFKEIDIETIYENKENKTSHFRPFVDALRIYRTPILYVIVSLLSFAIDITCFHLFSSFVFTSNGEQQVFLSSLCARVISGIFNFTMFHFVVFQSHDDLGRKAVKYWILWLINLGISSGLTYAFKHLPAHLTFIKFVIDTLISIANFIINLSVIFVRKKIKK